MQRHILGDIKYGFDNATLVGAYDATAADLDRRKVNNFNLPPIFCGVFAWVKTESDRYFHVFRMFHSAMTSRLRVTSAMAGGEGVDAPETLHSFQGYVREEASSDGWRLSGQRGSGISTKSFDLKLGRDLHGTWEDSGILRLDYHRLGPAVEMYFPDSTYSWYWNTLIFRVEGEILGEKVTGMGELEQSWGVGWQDWLEHPLHDTEFWTFFVRQDGKTGTEFGTLALRDGRGFGVIVNGGVAEALYGIQYQGARGEDGLPDSVAWSHDGREWELTLQTRSIGSPQNPGYLWQLGTMDRQGAETTDGFGFVETRGRERPYHLT